MKTTITAKNMNVSPAVEARILKKIEKMERYFRTETEMLVRLRKEGVNRRIVEITVPFEGVMMRSEASSEDNLYMSIDKALAKLEKQVHKHRTRLEKRLRDDAFKNIDFEFIEDAPSAEDSAQRQVVRTKQFPVRPMSAEDAAMQMELLGHAFFVFVNIDTERTNVLYLRKDGNLGLLEPEA